MRQIIRTTAVVVSLLFVAAGCSRGDDSGQASASSTSSTVSKATPSTQQLSNDDIKKIMASTTTTAPGSGVTVPVRAGGRHGQVPGRSAEWNLALRHSADGLCVRFTTTGEAADSGDYCDAQLPVEVLSLQLGPGRYAFYGIVDPRATSVTATFDDSDERATATVYVNSDATDVGTYVFFASVDTIHELKAIDATGNPVAIFPPH